MSRRPTFAQRSAPQPRRQLQQLAVSCSSRQCLFEQATRMATTALPAPALEAWRLRAIHELRSTFTELCEPFLAEGTRNAARRERTMCKAFETWLFSCRSAAMSDDWERRALPIVPGMPAAGHDEALRRKLCLAGATAVQAEGVLDKLSTAATKLAVVAEHVPETVAGSIVESNCKDGMVTLVCAQQSVRCTSHHLVKLWALHQAAKRESKPCAVQWVRPRSGSCCPSVEPRVKAILANRQFVTAVYCVLARYLSLQGGSRRGGRMQVRHATECGCCRLPSPTCTRLPFRQPAFVFSNSSACPWSALRRRSTAIFLASVLRSRIRTVPLAVWVPFSSSCQQVACTKPTHPSRRCCAPSCLPCR